MVAHHFCKRSTVNFAKVGSSAFGATGAELNPMQTTRPVPPIRCLSVHIMLPHARLCVLVLFFTMSATLLLTCASCASTANRKAALGTPAPLVKTVSTAGYRTVQEIVQGYAVACRADGITGPFSYLARDLGKTGVPRPKNSDLQDLRRIKRRFPSATLRFAYIHGKFIVYNASFGPCETAAPGYRVLNGGSLDNLYYSPTETWDGLEAVPGA